MVLFSISFSLSIILSPFFPHYSLSLAILTCVLNRRLKSLSKALALVFKWAERETHSHCHIFSSSLHYSMFCVIFFFQRLSFPNVSLSADPFAKSYANQNNCFSLVASLLLCLLRGWQCFIFVSPVTLYNLTFKYFKIDLEGSKCCIDIKLCWWEPRWEFNGVLQPHVRYVRNDSCIPCHLCYPLRGDCVNKWMREREEVIQVDWTEGSLFYMAFEMFQNGSLFTFASWQLCVWVSVSGWCVTRM